MPTETEIKRWVDELITPENADTEARRLTQILHATACRQNDDRWNLTCVACRHAFSKTMEFEEAFREFAGIERVGALPPEETNIEIEKEQ